MAIIHVFLNSEEVFNYKPSKKELIETIESVNTYPLILFLSKLSYYEIATHEFDNFFINYLSIYYDKYNYSSNAKERLATDRILFSPQSIETLWKWILLYSKKCYVEEVFDIDNTLYLCICLMLGINSNFHFKNEDEFLINELNRNLYFNSVADIRGQIARTYFMFLDENVQLTLSKCNEYVDIHESFKIYYNYTLSDYVSVVFPLLFHFQNADKKLDKPWSLDFKKYYVETSVSKISNKIIHDLCADNNLNKWLENTIERNWDFEYFFNKPLVKVSTNNVIPISKAKLSYQLHNALHHKIRESFINKNSDFTTYMGRAFEYYLTWVTKETEKCSSKKKYEIIDEFYFNKKQYRSPDLMIKLGSNVLVIEAKLGRVAYKGMSGEDDSTLKKSQELLIYSSLIQTIKCIDKMIKYKANDKITLKDKYYIMTVTPDIVPYLGEFQNQINNILNDANLDIKYFGVSEVEEFEILIEYMYRKDSKSIFKMLDRISNKQAYTTIKNEMFASKMYPHTPIVVSKYMDNVLNKLITSLNM